MNITSPRSNPMLKRAGNETAREKRSVRIPLADFTKRRTRPTLNTLMTLSNVGEIKKLSSNSESDDAVRKKKKKR